MSDLVQLPPLRQSMVETAACPRAYVAVHIEGKHQPDSVASERGTDIHHVMSEYVRHCTAKKVSSDWVKFDELAKAAGPVAGPILDGKRDSYEVEWDKVYGTEVRLRLDEDFRPTVTESTGKGVNGFFPLDMISGVVYSEEPTAHTGTLDVILLSEDGLRAKIPDYKSHPAPFEADTFQSVLYPFMLFKHLPSLEVITFELDFVRYKNCLRSVVWRREEMPQMQSVISRARERQRITHENPDGAMALPCIVCTYCPLMKNLTCPVREWNEYTIVSTVDRLIAIENARRLIAFHRPILKAHAAVNGPVVYKDGNGRVFEYGQQEVPETKIELSRLSFAKLEEWSTESGEDWEKWNLNISSTTLKGKWNADKRKPMRAKLRETFEASFIQTSTKPKFAVRTPEGIAQDYNPQEEE